jgi:hypothetical protein
MKMFLKRREDVNFGYANVQMRECADVKMCGCADVRMIFRRCYMPKNYRGMMCGF